ncbi:hypothetical protein C1645_841066 [Glomus cerebriforme]|uniref:Uncharacterized protein n=1 Tax=Glomus cerebriforme TaxID=658196 RepID=A0A397S015_9GLOM|nr:hypothetical protein C1645_841066 [Glomus cerebriforme]
MGMYKETSGSQRHDSTRLQQVSPTIQEPSKIIYYKLRKRPGPIEGGDRWFYNSIMHSMGCALFPIHSQLSTKIVILLVVFTLGVRFRAAFTLLLSGFLFGFFCFEFIIYGILLSERRRHSAFGSACPMDYYPGDKGDVSISDQRFLETECIQYNQSIIRCVDYSYQAKRQKKNDRTSTEKRPKLFLPKPEYGEEIGALGYRELCGNQSVDASIPMEARSSNEILFNLCEEEKRGTSLSELSALLSHLKENCPFGFHEITSEKDLSDLSILLDEHDIRYFAKTFGIFRPRAVCIDKSGHSAFILDNRGYMFEYNDMERGMKYMGPNIIEGLTNYLFNPDKIYELIEDTCELITTEELERQAKEEMRDSITIVVTEHCY